MDSFTKKYLMFMGTLGAVGLVYWLTSWDSRVTDINGELLRDPLVGSYPYTFEVVRVEDGVAYMHSPRSGDFSVIHSLRVIHPELARKSAVSEEMVEAQQAMARVQSRAADIATKHAEVRRVSWVLDEVWLRRFGVVVQ